MGGNVTRKSNATFSELMNERSPKVTPKRHPVDIQLIVYFRLFFLEENGPKLAPFLISVVPI